MREIRRVEPIVDDEGWIVRDGYTAWDCDCGAEVCRYRGQSDVGCSECGQWYIGELERCKNCNVRRFINPHADPALDSMSHLCWKCCKPHGNEV